MAVQSLPAFRRVLAWAVEQGMSVRGQLSEEQLIALARVFAGQEQWNFGLYQPLRAFAHALSRLNLPDLPALLSFGDVLQALDEQRATTVAAWPTCVAVAESTFSALGYASTSSAITRIRDANAAAWREHGLRNKEFLWQGAERASGPRAVVVGAGKLYDIPLRKLAERFEQLLLVDIDLAAMEASVEQVGLEPELRARLLLVQADVTGINDAFLTRVRAALELASEDEVYQALLRVLHEYRVDEPPRLISEGAVTGALDFACSSMVLSQLATPLTSHVESRYRARFPMSQRTRVDEFQSALAQFTHRVQQAHVRSLLTTAPCIALSTDITDQYTSLDPYSSTIHGAAPLPLLGAPSLNALLPRQQARTLHGAEWQWQHIVPSRIKPHGRTVQVEGVVAERS